MKKLMIGFLLLASNAASANSAIFQVSSLNEVQKLVATMQQNRCALVKIEDNYAKGPRPRCICESVSYQFACYTNQGMVAKEFNVGTMGQFPSPRVSITPR